MFTIEVEPQNHPGYGTTMARVVLVAGSERFEIGTAWHRVASNEIRFDLSSELEELSEARYTRLPAIDLAIANVA